MISRTSQLARQVETWRCRELLAGGRSVLRYVPLLNKGYVEPTHLTALANLLGRISQGEEIRALISAPPRFGKSVLLTSAIARHLLLRPTDTIMYIGHGQELADDKSRAIRSMVQRAGLRLRSDTRSVSHWMTEAGGGVIAAGVGGSITGRGANLIICDDLVRSRSDAESRHLRSGIETWLTGTCLTRLEPGGSVVICAARYHVDDIHGRLAAQGGWEEINLPCYGPDGESIWAQRWSTRALKMKERELGSYDFSSLYLGNPVPPGNALFCSSPSFYRWPEVDRGRPVIVCDPATSAKTRADYSVALVGLIYRTDAGLPAIDLVDLWRAQCEAPLLLRKLQQLQQHWGAPVAIEAVGGFKTFVSMARSQRLKVIELTATTDKLSRSLPAAAMWQDGRVRLPRPETQAWVDPFVREVMSFTGVNDRHDDQVDSLAHLAQLAQPRPTVKRGVAVARNLAFG